MFKTRAACKTCGKMFKNSASLASHRHRYHPYSKDSEDDRLSLSSESSHSISSHNFLESKVNANQGEIKALDQVFGDILKRLDDLETTIPKNLPGVESKVNKMRIGSLKSKLDHTIEKIDNMNKITGEDRLGYMMEVKDMFLSSNYEKLKDNISKLKTVIDSMFKLDIGEDIILYEDEDLLEGIFNVSDYRAIEIVKDNFTHLVNIFVKLAPTFDKMYDDYYREQEEDVKEQSEIAYGDDVDGGENSEDSSEEGYDEEDESSTDNDETDNIQDD